MNWLNRNIGFVCVGLLLLFIFILPHAIIWDEQWYMNCVRNNDAYGFLSVKFLKWNPAAPGHSTIHYLFSPLTGLNSPQIRVFNFMMCVCVSLLIYKMLSWEEEESSKTSRLNHAFSMFLLPSFFVIGFFAITEAPCLLFYTLSVFCVLKYISDERKKIIYLLVGGLFLGVATATRQVFLVGIGPLCAMIFYKEFKMRVPAILLYFIGTMVLVVPLIYLWHGLAPMGSIFHYKSPVSFVSVKHVFLSFGYGFFYFLAIMPAYMFAFIKKHWKPLVVLAIIGLISSSLIRDDEFLPLAGLLPRVCSPAIIGVISYLFFKLIGMLSIMAIYFLCCELYYNRNDFKQVFMILSILAILTTPLAIFDQFSSRYSMQIAPILVLFAYSRIKPIDGRMQFLVNITAIVINVISVVTFFY